MNGIAAVPPDQGLLGLCVAEAITTAGSGQIPRRPKPGHKSNIKVHPPSETLTSDSSV